LPRFGVCNHEPRPARERARRPFKISPMNGREAGESGLWLRPRLHSPRFVLDLRNFPGADRDRQQHRAHFLEGGEKVFG
jgi:hypothetical protein